MGVFGGGGVLSKAAHGTVDTIKDAGRKIDDFAHDIGLVDAAGWAMGATTGYNPRLEYLRNKREQEALESQQRAYAEQSAEIARQKKIQQAQQRRENMQLMNTVSDLTNTSYGGISSPSIDYDKYGDLG